MIDFAIFMDWITFAVRWLHVVTAIAWIGSSFYFIALDLGLKKAPDLPVGASGEEWQVHGGGFYQIRKFLVAPPNLPEHLIWHKYQSYFTWLSGFVLLALVYYLHADLFLIDRNVLDVPVWQAIAISVGSLAIGWLIYDTLCKSPIGTSQNNRCNMVNCGRFLAPKSPNLAKKPSPRGRFCSQTTPFLLANHGFPSGFFGTSPSSRTIVRKLP